MITVPKPNFLVRNTRTYFGYYNFRIIRVNYFKSISFAEEDFRGIKCNRLRNLNHLIEDKKINSNLFWIQK